MRRLHSRWLLFATLSCGCLFETIGCPQLLGNALRDGTLLFLDQGLTAVLLEALGFEELFAAAG